MSIPHAKSGEIVDLFQKTQGFSEGQTRAIIKTDRLELGRIVLKKGKKMRPHQVDGPITIQCLDGQIALETSQSSQTLSAGQLVYLAPKEPHSVAALSDAVFLLTIVFAE